MSFWEESPIVSFARDGEEFVLGRDPGASVLHLNGTEGLGIAPVEHSSVERLVGDGNVHRGTRYGAREVYVPLMLEAESVPELDDLRRKLTSIVAPHLGPVEIRVQNPADDSVRMIRGRYKEGLEDGAGGPDYYGTWQTIGLTFECDDPWWLGPEQLVNLRIAPGTKPFLSKTTPFFPVTLARSTIVGTFPVTIRGAGPVSPAWQITGPGRDLVISNGDDVIEIHGEFPADETTVIDSSTGRITPDSRWDDTTDETVLFDLRPGRQTLRITLVNATPDTTVKIVYREKYLEAM